MKPSVILSGLAGGHINEAWDIYNLPMKHWPNDFHDWLLEEIRDESYAFPIMGINDDYEKDFRKLADRYFK